MAFARTPWELLGLRLMQGVFSGFVAPSLTLVSIGTSLPELVAALVAVEPLTDIPQMISGIALTMD